MPSQITRLTVQGLAVTRGLASIFEGVSFVLEAGGALIIRGPNGSGKSTLLRVLAGLMRPSEGAVICDAEGASGSEQSRSHLAHLVGHLAGVTDAMSVEENLAFHTALLGGEAAAIRPALARVGLQALVRQMGRTLSAGERRRLALARLLSAPRPLWLLDEPTESLDTAGAALVASLIAEHRAGGGIVVAATHGELPAERALELRLMPASAEAAS
jgi:heme exporter protein A